jgi:hypothetical protein
MRYWLPFLLGIGTAVLLWGCAGNPWAPSTHGAPVRRDIATGDRKKDWALVYYQSWRRERNALYLRLARDQMADAVKTYFALQVRIGHSYPDFYDLDRKRRESCRFLAEMDRDAGKFRVVLEDTAREGCLTPTQP